MIYCMGEALIDFTPLEGSMSFKSNPGGAPANVASTIAKLGGQSKMITQVGSDVFGDFLIQAMQDNGVDTEYVLQHPSYQTSLAFVSHDETGNRSFAFYRDNAADLMMEAKDYDFSMFRPTDMLHFCSVNLVDYPSRDTHRKAIEVMKAQGGKISFDPNLRFPLWDDNDELYDIVSEFLPLADVIKISDEELFFITKEADETLALNSLLFNENTIVIYTKGSEGMRFLSSRYDVSVKGIDVTVVDTTGAGDASIGSVLYYLQEWGFDLAREQIIEMLTLANKVAGITCTQYGGMSSVPRKEDL